MPSFDESASPLFFRVSIEVPGNTIDDSTIAFSCRDERVHTGDVEARAELVVLYEAVHADGVRAGPR